MGFCSAALELPLDELYRIEVLDLVNKGGIAEQVVGPLLRTLSSYFTSIPCSSAWAVKIRNSAVLLRICCFLLLFSIVHPHSSSRFLPVASKKTSNGFL